MAWYRGCLAPPNLDKWLEGRPLYFETQPHNARDVVHWPVEIVTIMSQVRDLQLQRLELKYLINESTAAGVRSFVRSYLDLDHFGFQQPNFSYPVHSLYLDSDSLALYRQTICGEPNRFKLRVRYYSSSPTAPVYLEIKRRVNAAVLKQRVGIARADAEAVLAGQLPYAALLPTPEAKGLGALQQFSRLMMEYQCQPRAHLFFLREAWVHRENNSVRVTMDRNVECEPESRIRFQTTTNQPARVFGANIVLELKFTGRFPDWFGELVRAFDLTQVSAAKYAAGVSLIGEERFSGRHQMYPILPDDHPRKTPLQKEPA